MFSYLWKRYGLNPLDQLLKRAKKSRAKRILLCWNRGLGDIPLGLYALTERIRTFLPQAEITYATRRDLADGFKMLNGVLTLIDPQWKRGVAFDLDDTLKRAGLQRCDFDLILEKPDPTRWLLWQIGKVTPRLNWDPGWDLLSERFSLSKEKRYIGVHVQTETQYNYEKNWPLEHWSTLFEKVTKERGVDILLFGFNRTQSFAGQGIWDLRGKTTLFEMFALIKNHCFSLVVPDSGVLSMTYYIDSVFPLDIVSLWADPRQGVLRQKVRSPNPQLHHIPLIAQKGDLKAISVDSVMQALFNQGRNRAC